MNLFYDKEEVIEHIRQYGTENDPSSHLPRRMSYPFLERRMLFFLENGLQFRSEIIDIMRVLSGFVSQVHSIICEEHAERERSSEEYAIESVLEPYQHGDAARQSAMERREPSRCEDMSCIYAFVSYDIDDHLSELDDASHDDHQKYRIHM